MLTEIKIGDISLHGRIYIPPMAGVTDLVYRQLAREFDPNVLLATEMLSSKALIHAQKKQLEHQHTLRMEIPDGEELTGIQLFGHEPEVMAEAAKIAEAQGAAFVDINMGCPVAKIVKGQDGAALMREPELAASIVAAVVQATNLPVTVKTRLGWCSESLNVVDLARRFEGLGVKAMTIHGRTRAQKYEGSANWDLIKDVVAAVKIPIFANGDVKSIADAKKILTVTGAAGIAIARATIGKPWFSKQVNHYLMTGDLLPEPSPEERVDLALKHCRLLVAYKGDYTGIQESRRHINSYTAGLVGAATLRSKINQINSYKEAEAILLDYKNELMSTSVLATIS